MGNMLFNKRLGDSLSGGAAVEGEKVGKEERRIFPEHMYTGPLKLGDPNYRGLSKMEEDPLIPQRMRDNARTVLCTDVVNKFEECSKQQGLSMFYKCQAPKDEMVSCIEKWFYDAEFKEAVIEEYLNERSHFRQTGIKTPRYKRGKVVYRDTEADPPLDENGKYRPRKPNGWDEAYGGQQPQWANFRYR